MEVETAGGGNAGAAVEAELTALVEGLYKPNKPPPGIMATAEAAMEAAVEGGSALGFTLAVTGDESFLLLSPYETRITKLQQNANKRTPFPCWSLPLMRHHSLVQQQSLLR